MAEIGRRNLLTVSRSSTAGFYLDGGKLGDIFLPPKQAPEDCSPGDALEVFVYHDNDGSLMASTQMPEVFCGEVASLRVTATSEVGAFLDWGLSKELLLPFSEQVGTIGEGRAVLVVVYQDVRGRLVASMRLDKHILDQAEGLRNGEKVSLIVGGKTELGYKCVVNHRFWGLLYDNELKSPLKRGQRLQGWVRRVRPDQRLDLSLNAPAHQRAPDVAAIIIRQLEQNDGFLALGDKSPPEAIQRIFGVSKKAFKQGLSKLYKERRINIEERGIRLLK